MIIYRLGQIYQQGSWSFAQVLRIPEAGSTYGDTPPFIGMIIINKIQKILLQRLKSIAGRGYYTAITGYKKDDTAIGGIYVHVSDDGWDRKGFIGIVIIIIYIVIIIYYYNFSVAWTQQAKLVPKDANVGERFGKWMVSSVKPDGVGTLLVSSPSKNKDSLITSSGAVYVFNGTGRHWSQMQKLEPFDVKKDDEFGSVMELDGDRAVIITTKSEYLNEYWGEIKPYPNHGAAYIYERNPKTLMWSYQSKLVPRDGIPGIEFGSTVSLTGNYALVSSKADDKTRVEILATLNSWQQDSSCLLYTSPSPRD